MIVGEFGLQGKVSVPLVADGDTWTVRQRSDGAFPSAVSTGATKKNSWKCISLMEPKHLNN